MPNRRELLHIPTELLHQIFQYLDEEDYSALRQTCWKTRQLVLPYVFNTVRVNFQRDDFLRNLRSQIQSLGDENGITRPAVQAFTREIDVIAPCGCGEHHVTGVERESQEPRQEKRSRDDTDMVFSPAQALSALQGIERVKFTRCDVRSGVFDTMVPVLDYLASLKTLRSVHISLAEVLVSGGPEHDPGCLKPLVITTDSKIENPFVGLFDASPGINKLELKAPWLCERYYLTELGWFFQNLSPLSLHSLYIDGWCIDDAGVQSLLPHLGQLRELYVSGRFDNVSLLWPALQAANIKLQVLHAKGKASPELLQYLSSFSGLQELSMSSAYEFDLRNYIPDIELAIRKHAPTLRELDIVDELGYGWAPDIREALMQCTNLQKLAVTALGLDSALWFHDLVYDLPLVETLQLSLWVQSNTETGEEQIVPCNFFDSLNSGYDTPPGRVIKVEWYDLSKGDHPCYCMLNRFNYRRSECSDDDWTDCSDDGSDDTSQDGCDDTSQDRPEDDKSDCSGTGSHDSADHVYDHGSRDDSDGDSDNDDNYSSDSSTKTEEQ